VFIDWLAPVPPGDSGVVTLELSRTGADGPWKRIVASTPNNGRHQTTLNTAGPSTETYLRARLETGAHGAVEHVMGPITIVGSACPADFNADGALNTQDVLAFLNAWASGDASADFNGDGAVNTLDVLAYLNAWSAGCL
jgi:hypothetical protein